jgi:hypothetical protein
VGDIRYRAWGAAKQITYGNGHALSLNYDARLRLTQWNIPGVLGYSYAYNSFNEQSGRVTFASNLTNGPGGRDASLDRSYDYDHVGRLVAAYTGTAALAHTGQGSTWGGDGPYAQVSGYDEWGNLTSRGGWGGENASYTASFNAQNRMTVNPSTGAAMQYDGSGKLSDDGGQSYNYDATGQQLSASFNGLQMEYDGDRLRIKKVENGGVMYYLRSSVLGGQIICEITGGGSWYRGYVCESVVENEQKESNCKFSPAMDHQRVS